MLRLIPFSVVILALILVRLSWVNGWFSSRPAEAAMATPARVEGSPAWTGEPKELTPDGKEWIQKMARDALTAPTLEARAAAVLATADESLAKIRATITSINAAEDAVTENVRQADTTGYKARRWVSLGEKSGYVTDMTQGSLKCTNRPLDVAIQGDGFLVVSLDRRAGGKLGFTRMGALFVNNKDELVIGLGEGYPIFPSIHVPNGVTNVAIGQDGTMEIVLPGTGTKQTVGRLTLTRFNNSSALTQREIGVFLATDDSGSGKSGFAGEDGFGLVQQGFLECSNVDLDGERLRLKFLNNWRAALDEALDGNKRGNVASTNE